MIQPKPVLKDDEFYFCDNGALYHGRCAGASARYSGRDLSGQPVERLTAADLAYMRSRNLRPACERCRVAA